MPTEFIENNINIRISSRGQNEINDLIGNPPSWLLTSGISLIALVTISVLSLAYFIEYPNKIKGIGTLSSDTPPVELISNANGYIEFLAKENRDTVQQGEILMYIHNSTNTEELSIFRNWIKKYKTINKWNSYLGHPFIKDLKLGMIQGEYANLQLEFGRLQQAINDRMTSKKVSAIAQEILSIKKLNNASEREKIIFYQEFELSRKDYSRNESLAQDGVISQLDLENSKAFLLQKERAYESMSNSIIQNEIRIEQLKLEQLNLKEIRKNLVLSHLYNIENTIAIIEAKMVEWEQRYVLTSPVTGVIQYDSKLHPNSSIKSNEKLGYIIPIESSQLRVKGEIAMANAGKVKVGQRTIMKFDAFPAKEYGLLVAPVLSISEIPNLNENGERFYLISYELAEPLITDYNKEILLRPDMSVQLEIITENRSLLDRIFNQIIDLVRNS